MKTIILMAVLLSLCPILAIAQTTRPSIALSTIADETGKPMIEAIVKVGDKPVEDVTLQFYAQRLFGNVMLGEDTTILPDGSAAVAFPSGLPGGPDGAIHVFVKIKSPAQFATITSVPVLFPSDVPRPKSDSFPRALWAPHAPFVLTATIFAIIAAVWISYAFVIGQIISIRKGSAT